MTRIDKNFHIQMSQRFRVKINQYRRVWNKTRIIFRKVRRIVVRERKETVVAAKILKKYLIKGNLTESEKKFLRGQAADIARILPIVAAQAVPAPIPITPVLIILGKKIGVDLVPKDQVTPEGYEPKIRKRKLRLFLKKMLKKQFKRTSKRNLKNKR